MSPASASSKDPVLSFQRLLWRLDHALQRRSKRTARELGLTGPQRLALRILGRFPGLPAGELAALLHLHPSTLTGVLARLEGKGWVRRRVDPKDRRRALFGLTERGGALDTGEAPTIEAAVRAALAGTPSAVGQAAREFLEHLARELERDAAPEPPSSRSSSFPGKKRSRA